MKSILIFALAVGALLSAAEAQTPAPSGAPTTPIVVQQPAPVTVTPGPNATVIINGQQYVLQPVPAPAPPAPPVVPAPPPAATFVLQPVVPPGPTNVTNTTTIHVDNAEFATTHEGFVVEMNQGPIQVGAVHVTGRGKEAARMASVLSERIGEARERMYGVATGIKSTCCRPPVVTVRAPYCTGLLPRTNCTGFCSCSIHAAEVARVYGPAANPNRYPCLCPQPCPECHGRMRYIRP